MKRNYWRPRRKGGFYEVLNGIGYAILVMFAFMGAFLCLLTFAAFFGLL